MKILIVRTFPDIINPKKYNVQEIGLAKALVRKGHECGIVLYHGKNKDSIEKVSVSCNNEEKYITIYRLHGYNFLKNGIFPSLKKITKQYDVIQVHEYDQITSWFYYGWSKKPVVIYHGPYYHSFNKGYNLKCKVFDNIFLKIKHRKNTPCIVKSHAAAEFLKKKGFFNTAPAGVGLDIENFKGQMKETDTAISTPKDKFNLLYVGKIEERRNPFFLLKVMQEVTSKNKKMNCIIIGNGEKEYTENFLKEAASMIEKGQLQYYDSASQGQLAELYQKVQLMIFPTHYDIYGMVLLEALYFGLPVISSKNGGADMLIKDGENSWCVPELEIKQWSDKIQEIYSDKEKYYQIKEYLLNNKGKNIFWDDICEIFEKKYIEAMRKV